MKKKYLLIFILFFIILAFCNASMAKDVEIVESEYKINDGVLIEQKDSLSEPDIQIIKTRSNLKFTQDSKIKDITSKVFGAVAYICYGAFFIVLVIKGVQLMNSAPDAKAEIKKEMVAIAIGGLILFSIRRILIIISNLNLFS